MQEPGVGAAAAQRHVERPEDELAVVDGRERPADNEAGVQVENRCVESWFSTFKSELGESFESYASAKEQVFDYVEVFYNQQRRHSTIGYLSPADFERQRLAAVEPAA